MGITVHDARYTIQSGMKDSNLKKPSRPRRRALGVATAIISVMITLLALEVVARILMPGARALENIVTQNSGGDSRAYSLKPGARVEFRGLVKRLDKPVVWQINAQGIRSDRPVPPKSNKFRIATFGDSETFGWSMSLALTFQKRMEQIDENVEVINLGIPGYNAENIADHMEEVLADLDADYVIYVAHKNDIHPSLTFSPILAKSYLLIGLRYAYFSLQLSKLSKQTGHRYSPESLKYFANQVDRMIEISRAENVPLLVSYLSKRISKAFPLLKEHDFQTLKKTGDTGPYKRSFRVGALSIEHGWKKFPRIGGHMGQAGHRETAEKFCLEISAGRKHSCVPPHWRPARDP